MDKDEFLKLALTGGAGVYEGVQIDLHRWRVMRVKGYGPRLDGDHLLGSEFDSGGRASTAIAAFDPASMTAVTSSGQPYRLVGQSAPDRDADRIWAMWTQRAGVKEWEDVSPEYERQIAQAQLAKADGLPSRQREE